MTDHVNDGDLVRLLDEGPEGQLISALQHVTSCADCSTRLESLRKRGQRMTTLLNDTDPPVPRFHLPAPSRNRALAAAAVLTLVLGGSLSVQPLRAWIIAQGRAVFGRSESVTPDGMTVTNVVTPTPDAGVTSVSFSPRDTVLVIEVMTWQRRGGLVIRAGGTAEITAATVEPNDEDGFVVLPNGLRIENTDRSIATYQVTVPRSILRVNVRVSGQSIRHVVTGTLFGEEVLDLRRSPS